MVDAFLAAARDGDFDGLIALLDPDVVLRADEGAATPPGYREVRGAENVANQALTFARAGGEDAVPRPVLVNGAVGVVGTRAGRPASVLGFTVTDGKIAAIDILADPDRLARLDLTVLD